MRVRDKREDSETRSTPARGELEARAPSEPYTAESRGGAAHEAAQQSRARAARPIVPQPKAEAWSNGGPPLDPFSRDGERAGEQSSGGAPLPAPTRALFEKRFGRSFDDVRVHTGPDSAQKAEALDARAFTTGRDVVFGDGEFQPDQARGRALIAHELTHVAQQSAAPAGALAVSRPSDASEREADHVASHVLSTDGVGAGAAPPVRVEQQVPQQIALQPRGGRESDMPDYAGPGQHLPHGAPAHTPAPEWDPEWGKKGVRDPDAELDKIQKTIGAPGGLPAMQAASVSGKTPISPTALTPSDIKAIMNPLPPAAGALDPKDPSQKAQRDWVDQMAVNQLGWIHTAFTTMQIDTVEAQALYLAHSYAESAKLTQLEEKGADKLSYAPFIGRGPTQVTGTEGYMKAFAYLRARAAQLAKQPGHEDEVKLLEETVREVKKDITRAANPKYAYLMSAALMHTAGVKASSSLGRTAGFAGNASEDAGMTGQTKPWTETASDLTAAERELAAARAQKPPNQARVDAAAEAVRLLPTRQHLDSAIKGAKQKSEAYGRAHSVLSARAAALKAAAASAPAAPAKKP